MSFGKFVARSATILIAEDDFDDTFLLRRVFDRGQFGCSLQFVANGEEVLAYLQRKPPFSDEATHPIPDLILLDLHMPKKDGFEVLEWLRKHPGLHRLVVVVFTSSDVPEDINRAYDLGANSYLVKPVEFVGLVETAKHLRDYWLKLNRRGHTDEGKKGKASDGED